MFIWILHKCRKYIVFGLLSLFVSKCTLMSISVLPKHFIFSKHVDSHYFIWQISLVASQFESAVSQDPRVVVLPSSTVNPCSTSTAVDVTFTYRHPTLRNTRLGAKVPSYGRWKGWEIELHDSTPCMEARIPSSGPEKDEIE
jgi:hypothetical protein